MTNDIDINLTLEQRMGQDLSTQSNLSSLTPNQIQEELVKKRAQLFHLNEKLASTEKQLSQTLDAEIATVKKEIQTLEKEDERRRLLTQAKLDAATLVQQEQEKKVLARRKAEAEKRSKQAQAFRVKHNAPLPTQNGQRLLSPAEIIGGKLPVGASTYAPMRLITMEADGKLVHRNEYTGVGKRGDLASTEKELIEKYHFSPAEAKRRAPEFTPEQYEKLLPPITEKSPTVSKISGIMVGASDYRGSDVPGRKGTAYHTATEMNIGGWSIAEILKEYENKSKGQPSKLTEQQYSDLYGLRYILKAAGGDKEILRQNVESFVEMAKKGIPAGSTPLMEQTLGAITNLGEGRLVPWGGTFDSLSKEGTLEDFKSNQKMSDKMGWQTNIYKFLIDLARMAGIDLPEVRQMLIANQPALTEKNLSPHPNIYGIKEIEPQTLARYLPEALAQSTGLKKKDPSVFASEKDLFSTFGHSSYITPEGKSITYWTDAKYGGGLKKMLEKSETSEDIANLAQYLQGYAPQELDEVMRNLFAHTQYDETGLKTPVDYFTTGQNWPEKGKTPKDALLKRLSALRKKMLPNAVSLGEPGRIQEESFAPSDEQGFVDFIKLEGLNIGDWAVTYKTAKEEKDEELANQIVTFIASTLQDYFKDSGDMESIRLGKKLADKIKDLSGYATSQISEKVYESLSQQVGEALGVKYRTGLDSEQINYTTEAAKYYAEEATTTRDTFGSAQSADTEQIEYNKQRQAERDSFESMRDRMEENVGFAIEKWGDEWTKTISTQDPEIIAHLLSRNYVAADVYDSVFKEALDTLNEGRDGEGQKLLTTVDLLNSTQRQEYLVSKALQKRFGIEREQAEAENRPYSYIDSFASIASGKEFTDQTEGFARLMSWMNRLMDSPLYDETARSSMESIFQRYGVGGLKYKYNVHDPSIVAKILDNEGYVGLTANYKAPDDRLREAQEKLDSLTKEFQAFLEPYQGKQVFNDEAEKQKAYQETSRLLTLIMSAQNAAEQVKEQLQTIREPNQHEMLTSEQEEQLEELKIAKYLDVEEKHRAQQIRQEPIPLPEYLTPGYKAYGLEDVKITPDKAYRLEDVKITPDNANLVDAFARLAGQDSESVIPAIDGTVVEQQEATSALEQRAGVEQEAIKIDQQSTQALRDESEALKNKAEIARELISALEDKNKTEKEAIATDEKSTKSTRKRVTASETLKQRLANQKVREQIAESKAKEAAALSKAGRGSGAKKQSAGEKEDYSKYAKNLKEITKAMFEREKIEKELNTTPSMLAKGRESREKLLIEYEGIIGKLTAQNELMIEQRRLSKEQVAQIEAEAQAQRRLNSLKVQGQKYGANSIFDVLKSGVKNTMARMFDYTGVYRVINKMAASLRNVVQLSKELDTAMFNLRVVSGDSREEAKGLISDYNDLAKQLGATTVEIANAANEWMRQGYEAEQATKLITASTYLSKLGMIDASQATEYLTSMIKGFKLEVSDAITVVDKLTKLDMVSATSSGGLAEAMRNVASSAQLANVSLDKTLAYAATIIETTQRDESSVGMSLRTILARYGNVKAGAFSNLNLAATGDADLENINDIEKVLKKIGISIRSSATEFRSFETVLGEVADKWERLDSVSKNAVATAFAGQRQRESFLVLMENMDRVDELTEISAESAGTATEKYQAYYESIESATKRLQTAWENLAHSFEVNGFVKGMTTFLTFVVENLPKIIKMVTVLVAQTNAWKVPTLLRAGLNATGLGALKGALKNNSQEKLGLMDRFKARAIARQNKQKDWKKTTLEKSDGLDLFGLKGKMSEVASNMDKLVLALDANTKAQTRQTQVETQQIRSGTQANILSPVPNASEGYSIDEFEKTQKVPEFKLKNLRSDRGTKSKIKDLYPNVPEFKLKNLQADGTDLPPMQNTLRTGLMGAAGAGIAAGVIGGITQEGSTEAKIASGATQGAFAALGGIASIWLGPLGTMLGSVLGDVLGPIVADAVDKEADDRKKLVEVGQKQLDMLSSLDSSFDTLDSSSRVELLSADDISSIRDIVSSIEETIQAEDSNLGKHLKKAFEEIGASEFYNNWDSKLVLGNQKERRAITRALQLAKSEAESEAYENSMAEKKYAALTTAEAKTYYKKVDEANVERAYIKSGVSEYSQYELTKKGIDGVINEVAKQLEGVDLKGIRLRDSFGELTEEAEAYIRTLMKTDDQMQNLLAGQTLTLNEALQEDNTELLEQFATALGVSVDKLQGFADTVGALTLGDLLAGMGETREKITSYTGLLSDFFTTGTVSPENLEDIIANYPDLINKVSNPKELLAGVQEKISQLGTQYVSAGISSWFSSEAVFDQFRKNFVDRDGFKEIFSNKELLGDVKSLDEAKGIILKMRQEGSEYSEQAKELYDYIIEAGDAAQVELEYIRKQLEYTAEIEATMDTVDKNYEKQINALEEQKSALEDINSQREYENKLIEAKIKLENAQNEKKKVWREGVGWVYETDTTAIADAQQELDDLANQKTIDELQAQIDELQAQREYVAGIPDRLELEQANENFKTWTDKLGLVNDNQLSVIDKIQEVWTELKTRSDEIEGRSETKSQFEQASQQKTAAEISLVGSGGSASAPASGSAQANLQEAYEAVKKFDQSDNSQEAQTARTKFADALKNYQEVYGKYVGAGGTVSKEQELLNALQADSDDLRFAPKWEGVRFPGLSNKGNTFTYYASFEDVTDSPDSGWRQGKMRDVVLLGGINQRADEYGVKNFDELKNMNGQLFMNTEGVDQVFWAYGGHVYKASRHQEDWKATQNVKDDAPYYNSGKKSKGSGLTTADNNKFYYAEGTLSAPGGASMVNDDPQYGLEGIITPQGTLTALPSKSGVVPADMTRNVWQLGEVAPNLIKQLVDINGKFNSPLGFGTDESFNVDHLDVHMVAQPGFDMDDFVRQLRAARDLSKHS